jgi:uncharacterized protein (TIGR03435 family)
MMLRVGICLWAAMAVAQAPEFEVASIRLSGPKSERGSRSGPDSYSFHKGNLDDFIAIAFDVEYRQISSKLPLDKDSFDFDAKMAAGTTRKQMHVMLQNFLAERFHLKHHMETREFTGYELVVAKNGPKLLAAGTAPEHLEGFPDLNMNRPDMRSVHTISNGNLLVRMRGRLRTTAQLADSLQPPDDGPVADKTGLPGKYDFALEYGMERPGAPPSDVPDLFTALQQQLGLQLLRKKIPLDVVVVDSIDKLPTGN